MLRHCALANFGPSAPIQVSGDLFIAEESDLGLLCNKGSTSQANSAVTQVASLLRKSFLPTVSQSAIAALLEKGDNLFASKLNWWKKLKETLLLQFGAQKLTIEIETDDTSSSDSEVSKVVNSLLASKVTSETTDVNEDNMLSSEMTEEEEETSTTSSVPSDDLTDVDLSRRIVLVKRGDCLFEEKALNAQHRGGVALLVQNREVSAISVISSSLILFRTIFSLWPEREMWRSYTQKATQLTPTTRHRRPLNLRVSLRTPRFRGNRRNRHSCLTRHQKVSQHRQQ